MSSCSQGSSVLSVPGSSRHWSEESSDESFLLPPGCQETLEQDSSLSSSEGGKETVPRQLQVPTQRKLSVPCERRLSVSFVPFPARAMSVSVDVELPPPRPSFSSEWTRVFELHSHGDMESSNWREVLAVRSGELDQLMTLAGTESPEVGSPRSSHTRRGTKVGYHDKCVPQRRKSSVKATRVRYGLEKRSNSAEDQTQDFWPPWWYERRDGEDPFQFGPSPHGKSERPEDWQERDFKCRQWLRLGD